MFSGFTCVFMIVYLFHNADIAERQIKLNTKPEVHVVTNFFRFFLVISGVFETLAFINELLVIMSIYKYPMY